MKRQRNMFQMKKHSKKPQDQTNKWEIRCLCEKEFRVMIVKMIQNLREKMEAQSYLLTGGPDQEDARNV